jgi:hypothetical protein
MARTKQTARKSTNGKPPKSNPTRSAECRERKKAKVADKLNNITVLFIVSEAHLEKVEVEPHHIPWANKLLSNHCIFAMNNVHTATMVDEHMTINSDTPEGTIQNIIDNHPTDDDIPHDPFQPISVMGANVNYEMPDANQAVALSFKEAFKQNQPKGEDPVTPIIYFVKRQTLMYCIDHPTDNSKKDIAFAFIKNNFDHVYLCNDDDLRCPVSSIAAPNPKLSKWHCLLDFLATLRIAGYTSIYPPLSMVHFLEDKYEPALFPVIHTTFVN